MVNPKHFLFCNLITAKPCISSVSQGKPCSLPVRIPIRNITKKTPFWVVLVWLPNRDFCRHCRAFASLRSLPSSAENSSPDCFPSARQALLPPCSNPYVKITKKPSLRMVFVWLPNRDSNPNKQSQSLSCYRYTIRQYHRNECYYSTMGLICQYLFSHFFDFFIRYYREVKVWF